MSSILRFVHNGVLVTTSSWSIGTNSGDELVIFFLWSADHGGRITGQATQHTTLPITLAEFDEAVKYPTGLGFIDLRPVVAKAR